MEHDIAEIDKPFWLKENFAPVHEETTSESLTVTGTIPPELNGRYFRNGPNPPSGKSIDWFMGSGMIHGVQLRQGKATWYRNRYVQTPLLKEDVVVGASLMNIEHSIANTHIIEHAGKILALAETSLPIELSHDLDTLGPYRFGGKLNGNMTAHPKICPKTGELLAFAYGIMPPYLTYYRVSAAGELVQREEIAVKGATMMHDFSITENYAIFLDLPMVWDLSNVATSGLALKFDESYGARIGVMPRAGSSDDVRWFDVDPCYIYHALNSHEAGDEIVVDACRMVGYTTVGMKDPPLPTLCQWRLNLKTGLSSCRQIDDAGVEFPRVPDSLVGQPYRYGYASEFNKHVPIIQEYHKYDMHTGARTTHRLAGGRSGGEAVFVPAAGATSEDDGYLMTYAFDPAEGKGELVILDASNMASPPVATVHLPVRVPAGFHGSWIADPA